MLMLNMFCSISHSTDSSPKRLIVAYNETTAYIVPLVKAVYAEIGIQASFVLAPSERAISGTNMNQFDADLSRVEGSLKNYHNLVFTKEPLKKTELFPYVKKGNPIQIRNIQDIQTHTIGFSLGSKLPELFSTKNNLTPQIANSITSLIAMLVNDRFEIALLTDTQLHSLSSDNLAKISQAGPSLESSHSFHVLNKKHINLVPKFDSILKRMKYDGRYSKLLKK